jgi:hypothetical protein
VGEDATLLLRRVPELEIHAAEGMGWFVNLRPTVPDDRSWFEPLIETFTGERLPWAVTGRRTGSRRCRRSGSFPG